MAGLLVFACGSTPGDDPADDIKAHADVTEKFVNDLEKATSAQDVGKAMEDMGNEMAKLGE